MSSEFDRFESVSASAVKSTADVTFIDSSDIKAVVELAKSAPNRRGRILLHPESTDSFHEMVIAIPLDSFDHPHINHKSGKSFVALSGTFSVVVFSEDGQEINHHVLSAEGKSTGLMIRLQKAAWHTILPISGDVVYLESILGPFEGNYFAEWFPAQAGREKQEFLEMVRSKLPKG